MGRVGRKETCLTAVSWHRSGHRRWPTEGSKWLTVARPFCVCSTVVGIQKLKLSVSLGTRCPVLVLGHNGFLVGIRHNPLRGEAKVSLSVEDPPRTER